MSSSSFLMRRDIALTLRMSELVKENEELTKKILQVESENDRLKIANLRLDGIRQALQAKLEKSNKKTGHLRMMRNRPKANTESFEQVDQHIGGTY